MDTLTLYGIKTCGSVQKARKYLESHGIAYTFVDWKSTPLDSATLSLFVEALGVDALLNTKGTTYKKLGLKEQNLDDNGKIAAMLQHPLLIKRPVIVYTHNAKRTILVGYDEATYNQTFAH